MLYCAADLWPVCCGLLRTCIYITARFYQKLYVENNCDQAAAALNDLDGVTGVECVRRLERSAECTYNTTPYL